MKKIAKAAALLAAMALATGLTACQRKGSSKGLVIEGTVTDFTPDVPAKLVIPQGVSKIGGSAFSNCLTLVSVVIPDTVTSIGMYAFNGCKNLKSVTIGKGVTDIGFAAFAICTSLEKVTIGNGVETISKGSFAKCPSLKNVSIPVSVKVIHQSAFIECNSLEEVKYAGTKAQWEKIEKSNSGLEGDVSFTVKCKDGDVVVGVKESTTSNIEKVGELVRSLLSE